MDLIRIIQDLRQERDKLEAIIASLEQLKAPGVHVQYQAARRGRRSMDAAGRLEVSRRMKQYWENKRKEGQVGSPSADEFHSVSGSFTA